MNKYILFLITAFIINPGTAFSQGQVASRLIRGSNFQIGVGYQYQRIDLEDLNSTTAASGYPALSESIHSVSFMTQNISNDLVLTVKTSFSFGNEEEAGAREMEFRNQQYSLGLGYNVLNSESSRLIPSVMGTLSRNILILEDNSNVSTNFQNLLQNPTGQADLRNFSYLADAGLAFHYMLFRREREQEYGKTSSWIPVIFKAGYQFQLGNSDFEFDSDKVSGVPDISLGGFYASVHIGLGSRILP